MASEATSAPAPPTATPLAPGSQAQVARDGSEGAAQPAATASGASTGGLSFLSVYEGQCSLRGESPDHADIYRCLDEVWAWVEAGPERRAALDENKLCIAVPAPWPASNAPKFFYDVLAENKQPLYLLDPTTDGFRAEILSRLAAFKADPLVVAYHGGRRDFLRWQLGRLEKRHKLGTWEAYAAAYR